MAQTSAERIGKQHSGANSTAQVHSAPKGPGVHGFGAKIDQQTRASLEPQFGHDFSNVRVHTDSEAALAARSLGANAFTVGSDLYFGDGKYDPSSKSGMYLLAHELTHVAQSREQGHSSSNLTSKRSDSAEAEARVAADLVMEGKQVPALNSAPATVSMDGEEGGGHGHAGWMDRLFGLNPDKSFVETGMEGLGYGPTGIWGRPRGKDEGDLSMLGRGLGAAAVSPLAAFAAIGGHALDEINHGPSLLHGAFDK